MSQLDSHGTFLLFSLQTTAPLLGISPFEYLLLPPRSALKAVPLKSSRQVHYPHPSLAFHSKLSTGRLLLYSLKIPVHTGASSLPKSFLPPKARKKSPQGASPLAPSWRKQKPSRPPTQHETNLQIVLVMYRSNTSLLCSSAIHFQGQFIRQVSCYTLLSGYRLPWPPSCCLNELTPFMVSVWA